MYESDPQRISQEDQCHQNSVGEILAKAEFVARGVLESIQAVAGTTNCKGIQISILKKWATNNGYWIEDTSHLGDYVDRGSENEVYLCRKESYVYKLNDFRYSDDNLMPFFERVKAHNLYFPDCAYQMVGVAENREGDVCAVLCQPYILSSREATCKEISDELIRLGFHPEMSGEYYTNGAHDIFDASPNNVLVGVDGNFYFIDTIIYHSSESNVETYHSQSPKGK